MSKIKSIDWNYLAGFKFKTGFHRMYKSFVKGVEVRKEITSRTTTFYIVGRIDQTGEFTNEYEFIRHLNEVL